MASGVIIMEVDRSSASEEGHFDLRIFLLIVFGLQVTGSESLLEMDATSLCDASICE